VELLVSVYVYVASVHINTFPHAVSSTICSLIYTIILCVFDCLKAYKVVVVPEEMKDETQAAMLAPSSCHVYSIQNCKLKVCVTNSS